MASPLGHSLARSDFQILAQVGEGTYGRVFKAVHISTRTLVALKIVNNIEEEDGLSFTAIREIKYLQTLKQNPNIIKLLGNCFWDDGSLVLVFEYMENDLSGLLSLSGVELQPAQIKCFMQQLLEGLHACHLAGIMHRDIKAANLLINAGTLKLADFGLATSYTTRNSFSTNVVTLWYRAPELLLAQQKYKAKVDIWSAGCIFIELLTRTSPFPGRDEKNQMELIFKICGTPNEQNWPGITKMEAWKQHVRAMPPCRNKIRELFAHEYPLVERNAVDLIEKMLTLDPEKRISASEALDHDYFWSVPMPCKPSDLPIFPSLHEYEAKEKRKTHAAKRQKGMSYEAPTKTAGFSGHTRPQVSVSGYPVPQQQNTTTTTTNDTQQTHNNTNSHPVPPAIPPSHREGIASETSRRGDHHYSREDNNHHHHSNNHHSHHHREDSREHNERGRDDALPPQGNTRRVVDSGDMHVDRRGGGSYVQNGREGGRNIYEGRRVENSSSNSNNNNSTTNAGWRSSTISSSSNHSLSSSSSSSSSSSNGHHRSSSSSSSSSSRSNRDAPSPPGLREDVVDGMEGRPPSDQSPSSNNASHSNSHSNSTNHNHSSLSNNSNSSYYKRKRAD